MKPETDTRHKLLQTTLDLIWEHSYGSVSVDDICKRAGVLKGSFYHFFKSKSDLAVAAYEEHWTANRRPMLDRVFSAQLPPLERFMVYCDQVYETQVQRSTKTGKVCGCPFSSLGSELSTQDENIRLKSKEVAGRYCMYFESALREGIRQGVFPPGDPKIQARELYSLVTGMLLQARIAGDLTLIKGLKPAFRRLLGMSVKAAA